MRICLLTNQDLNADPFPDDDWPCDPRPFVPEAEWHAEMLEKATAVRRIRELAKEGFDVFFNLCDGARDEDDNPGIEVVRTLEKLQVSLHRCDVAVLRAVAHGGQARGPAARGWRARVRCS